MIRFLRSLRPYFQQVTSGNRKSEPSVLNSDRQYLGYSVLHGTRRSSPFRDSDSLIQPSVASIPRFETWLGQQMRFSELGHLTGVYRRREVLIDDKYSRALEVDDRTIVRLECDAYVKTCRSIGIEDYPIRSTRRDDASNPIPVDSSSCNGID